jgi:hypothetical protein
MTIQANVTPKLRLVVVYSTPGCILLTQNPVPRTFVKPWAYWESTKAMWGRDRAPNQSVRDLGVDWTYFFARSNQSLNEAYLEYSLGSSRLQILP